MRWFLDTEFDEDGKTIDLISIALVSEDGREYYAALKDGWTPSKCCDWVKANVLPKLPSMDSPAWRYRSDVAADIKSLLLPGGVVYDPEIWGYFADYDWVALCQLYGRMVDLPKGFPKYCRDIKQEMSRFGVRKSDLPQLPEGEAHDALCDARWTRDAYAYIRRTHG